MSSNDIAIRVSNLSKCYHIYDAPRDRLKQFVLPRLQRLARQPSKQYFREFWALKDVSFEVKKGETVGIIGRNGSGKSTLLQMICGTLNPTSGSIQTNGRIAALLELGSGFNPEFTGRENVYMNAAVLGLNQSEVDERFEEITEFAGIGEFIDQPVKTYSSGMTVRLAFAISVCVEPDILIVDEALAVGDAAFQFKCMERLQSLTQSGTTLLFVSHDMSMVKNFCESAIYLQSGSKRVQGSPEEIAELYFIDIRDEQKRNQAAKQRVTVKPFLGKRRGIAFGTDDGKIESIQFEPDGGQSAIFKMGGLARVTIEVTYKDTVLYPRLSLLIQDQRMVNIGGRHFNLDGKSSGGGIKRAKVDIDIPICFTPGRYHVTARLEDRRSDQLMMPIDKQVGVLMFEVSGSNGDFLGPVALDIHQLSI
ncbi:MAG: ABC transporter ATP-binding protein [Methylobacter sp.]|nr:ABC transporter ATP-binding protein [Methylobacter sp.]